MNFELMSKVLKISNCYREYYILYNKFLDLENTIKSINFLIVTKNNSDHNLKVFKEIIKKNHSIDTDNINSFNELVDLIKELEKIYLDSANKILSKEVDEAIRDRLRKIMNKNNIFLK